MPNWISIVVTVKSCARSERRKLSRTEWALFETLYAACGSPVSSAFLVKAIAASGMREHVRRLRQALLGSRYRIETFRGIGYALFVAPR